MVQVIAQPFFYALNRMFQYCMYLRQLRGRAAGNPTVTILLYRLSAKPPFCVHIVTAHSGTFLAYDMLTMNFGYTLILVSALFVHKYI